jgi:hypothetical protein
MAPQGHALICILVFYSAGCRLPLSFTQDPNHRAPRARRPQNTMTMREVMDFSCDVVEYW